MDLKFKISYPLNLFQLVDNLSNWSVSNRDYYKNHYPEIHKVLKPFFKDYITVRKKYGWGRMEPFFVTSSLKVADQRLKNKLTKQEYLAVSTPIKLADKHFKEIFVKRKLFLKQFGFLLQAVHDKYGKAASQEISKVLDIETPEKVNVFLIFNPHGGGGGSNLGGAGITIEIGDLRYSPAYKYDVILHEIIHFTEDYHDRRKKWISADRFKAVDRLIEEAITKIFVPKGLISAKIGLANYVPIPTFKTTKPTYLKIRKYIKTIEPLAQEYYDNVDKQNFWNDFLPKVVRHLKKNPLK